MNHRISTKTEFLCPELKYSGKKFCDAFKPLLDEDIYDHSFSLGPGCLRKNLGEKLLDLKGIFRKELNLKLNLKI
jgi:hypothetical protein